MPDTTHETLMMEKCLKESIIEHGKAAFSYKYDIDHVWSVVLEKSGNYTAKLLVYQGTHGKIKPTVAIASAVKYSAKTALEDLLDNLQRTLARASAIKK